jgi:hypothetical protein
MRFRNESGSWSSWEPFSENKPWNLSNGFGTKTVTVEIRNSGGDVKTSQDTIDYVDRQQGVMIFASNWGSLYSSTLNEGSESWSHWESNAGFTIDKPVQTVFQGNIVQVVRGGGDWIYTRTSADGVNWGNWSAPNGKTIDTPSLIEFNGKLIQTVRGTGDWIYTRTSADGVTWSAWSAPNGRTIDTPVQVVFNNKLVSSSSRNR